MRIALLTGVLVAALLLAGGLVARGTPPRTGVPAIELRAETTRPGQPLRPRERARRRLEAAAGSPGRPRSSGALPAPAPAPAPVGDDAGDDADDDDRSDDGDDD